MTASKYDVFYDVIVIGAGPAGLAAALASDERGAKTLLIEREEKLGGVLKQCIHDGFGLIRFGEKLTGPEYAHKFLLKIQESNVQIVPLTFVLRINKLETGFELIIVNRKGVIKTTCKCLVIACGCRERTAQQIGIHGVFSAGILTAGTAQYYTNILGKLPGKRCVILGSGDIGLIMARRLTIEGANVIGVYEAGSSATGLLRNVYQCLNDFDIPLYTNKTVTRVFGDGRLKAVETASVDGNMTPVPGTEEIIECDALILSVGLIPENELAESLGLRLNEKTKGPEVDQNFMTDIDGVFCCGNALHVNDLVDYVTESGESAGGAAAKRALLDNNNDDNFIDISFNNKILYVVPQKLNIKKIIKPVIFYFRSSGEMGKADLSVSLNGNVISKKSFLRLRTPEMERHEIDFSNMEVKCGDKINFTLLGAE